MRISVWPFGSCDQPLNGFVGSNRCGHGHVGEAGHAVPESFVHGHDGAITLEYGLQNAHMNVMVMARDGQSTHAPLGNHKSDCSIKTAWGQRSRV